MEKRMEKRKNHRMAALDLDPSSIKVNHSNISSMVLAVMKLKLPVLDPLVSFWILSMMRIGSGFIAKN
jgi:hypothetical protein